MHWSIVYVPCHPQTLFHYRIIIFKITLGQLLGKAFPDVILRDQDETNYQRFLLVWRAPTPQTLHYSTTGREFYQRFQLSETFRSRERANMVATPFDEEVMCQSFDQTVEPQVVCHQLMFALDSQNGPKVWSTFATIADGIVEKMPVQMEVLVARRDAIFAGLEFTTTFPQEIQFIILEYDHWFTHTSNTTMTRCLAINQKLQSLLAQRQAERDAVEEKYKLAIEFAQTSQRTARLEKAVLQIDIEKKRSAWCREDTLADFELQHPNFLKPVETIENKNAKAETRKQIKWMSARDPF